jgi:hypothetical protein
LYFLQNSFSVNRLPENHIASFWTTDFHDAIILSLSSAYNPFIFCLHGMINIITSTWSTSFFSVNGPHEVCTISFDVKIPCRYIPSLANAYLQATFCLQRMIKGIPSTRSTRLSPWLLQNSFSVNRPHEIRPFSSWSLYIQSLSRGCTQFIFWLQRMMKDITSTWSVDCWLGIFQNSFFGHSPTRKPYRAIWTAESMTLHTKSIQRIHPIQLLPSAHDQ